MKKKIKLNFYGFWNNFKINDFYIINELKKQYDIEISENPEYVIYSCFGSYNELKRKYSNSIKIFYTSENIKPNFFIADYAIGFDPNIKNNRYIRMPNYCVISYDIENLKKAEVKHMDILNDNVKLLNRNFCSFVVSNPYDKTNRIEMFKELSKYKKIDSGGRVLNNIGNLVEDKISFAKNYKFSLCFENDISDGYVTEKIIDAFAANTIPIYLGCKDIDNYVNEKAFINVSKFDNFQKAIEKIIELDNNNELYISMLKEPAFKGMTFENENKKLLSFFINIFENPKSKKQM